MNNYTDSSSETTKPLFSIQLNERGRAAIKGFRTIVITSFITGIMYTATAITLGILYVVKYGVAISPSADLSEIRSVTWPLLMILFDTLYLIQVIKLNRFSKKLHNAVQSNDEAMFNESFHNMHTYVAIAIVSNIIMTMLVLVDLYLVITFTSASI